MKFTYGLLLFAFPLFLAFGFSQSHTTQQQALFGTVLDDSGRPVVGGTVKVFERDVLITGTQTDSKGHYQIALDSGTYAVEFSYVGFAPETVSDVAITAGSRIELNHTLSAPSVTLEEAIVTAYQVDPMRCDETSQGLTLHNSQPTQQSVRAAKKLYNTSPAPAVRYQEAPPVAAGESYTSFRENQFVRPAAEPLSTFGADVDVASYANVRRFIQQGQLPPAEAVRTEELINYFDYAYPTPTNGAPVSFTTELFASPWSPGHQLLHIGLQARDLPKEQLPPSNLVFLLDVSGSMSAPNKLPLLKQGFRLLTEQLRPEDRVSIVVYAGAAGAVLEPTSGAAKQDILAALDRLKAGGSTAGAAGLKLAYQYAEQHFTPTGNNRIILATDGDFNVGTTDNQSLEDYVASKRDRGIFLSVLGFGNGNYQDDRMQTLTEKGNGNAAYIDNLLEARKVLVEEFGSTLFTVAKDVKLQVEFNPAKVAAYRLIGYESRLLAAEDFNDDRKDAGDMGSGHTVTALYDIIPVGAQSPLLPTVDALKYQTPSRPLATPGADWATVRMKYKEPRDSRSKAKVEVAVTGKPTSWKYASEQGRWATTIAGWSMLMKKSDYLGALTYPKLIALAEDSRQPDLQGYRAEAIRLMKAAQNLDAPELVEAHN